MAGLGRRCALPLLVALLLQGCALIHSPTAFTLSTPVRVAADGSHLIFKVAGESNTCALFGGPVSFVAVSPPGATHPPLTFEYDRSTVSPRNDIVTWSTVAGSLSIDGDGEYALTRAGTARSWRPIGHLGMRDDGLLDRAGDGLVVVLTRPGRIHVRALVAMHRDAFSGDVIPASGRVFLRHAVFSSVVASYKAKSEHDCGNWDTPQDAAEALNRVESAIPP